MLTNIKTSSQKFNELLRGEFLFYEVFYIIPIFPTFVTCLT